MRTGKTRLHYQKQKNDSYAYFRVKKEDAGKIRSHQFTIYDFITGSFYFSPTKKHLAVNILQELKKNPASFSQLQKGLDAKKSTLYLLCLALEKSGLIEKTDSGYALSNGFSSALSEYANWWGDWLKD